MGRVTWEVQYDVKGEPHWWEYPRTVVSELESIIEGQKNKRKRKSMDTTFQYVHKYPKTNYQPQGSWLDAIATKRRRDGLAFHSYAEYILDPLNLLQTNNDTGNTRPMRRIHILRPSDTERN